MGIDPRCLSKFNIRNTGHLRTPISMMPDTRPKPEPERKPESASSFHTSRLEYPLVDTKAQLMPASFPAGKVKPASGWIMCVLRPFPLPVPIFSLVRVCMCSVVLRAPRVNKNERTDCAKCVPVEPQHTTMRVLERHRLLHERPPSPVREDRSSDWTAFKMVSARVALADGASWPVSAGSVGLTGCSASSSSSFAVEVTVVGCP